MNSLKTNVPKYDVYAYNGILTTEHPPIFRTGFALNQVPVINHYATFCCLVKYLLKGI